MQTERAHLRALVKAAALRWWRPYLVHVPNERASPRERNALRGCAVSKGFPDLTLWLPRDGAFLAAVELKAGADTTPEQEAWIAFLRCVGCPARVIEGWPRAFAFLDRYAGERRPGDPPPPAADALESLAASLVQAAPPGP